MLGPEDERPEWVSEASEEERQQAQGWCSQDDDV